MNEFVKVDMRFRAEDAWLKVIILPEPAIFYTLMEDGEYSEEKKENTVFILGNAEAFGLLAEQITRFLIARKPEELKIVYQSSDDVMLSGSSGLCFEFDQSLDE